MERALCRRRKRRKSGLYDSAVNVFGTRIIKGGDVDEMFAKYENFRGGLFFPWVVIMNHFSHAQLIHVVRLVFYYYYLYLFSP